MDNYLILPLSTIRKNVEEYISNGECSLTDPLYMGPSPNLSQQENELKIIRYDLGMKRARTLECMIILTLYYSKFLSSYNSKTKVLETAPNKRRSVLDIWRHIIYFHPEISIFSVMAMLTSKRVKHKLFSTVCYSLGRRVFKLNNRVTGFQSDRKLYLTYPDGSPLLDEFHLSFEHDWTRINSDPEDK